VPTGTVTFTDDSEGELGTVSLVNGAASITTSTLSARRHTITARYSGDTNYPPSAVPSSFTQVVNQAATNTGIVYSNSLGQVTVTATMTVQAPGGRTPVGQVEFWSWAGDVFCPLVNGMASYTAPDSFFGGNIQARYHDANRQYLREMKRYGILPPQFDVAKDPINVFQVDQAYWRSAWPAPDGRGPAARHN
jgi:hypothetical protein